MCIWLCLLSTVALLQKCAHIVRTRSDKMLPNLETGSSMSYNNAQSQIQSGKTFFSKVTNITIYFTTDHSLPVYRVIHFFLQMGLLQSLFYKNWYTDYQARQNRDLQAYYERSIGLNNDAESMLSLARILEHGTNGVSRDPRQAFDLYHRAYSEHNNHPAGISMGRMLIQGIAGDQPEHALRAEALFHTAIVKDDDPSAMYELAKLRLHGACGVSADVVGAKELLERAVHEHMHLDSMVLLGDMLVHETDGIKKETVRGRRLLERVVKTRFDVQARYCLARLFDSGAEGVEKDSRLAMYHAAFACCGEKPNLDAMILYGRLMELGYDGEQPRPELAVKMYDRAIQAGDRGEACERMAGILEHGAPDVMRDLDRSQRLRQMMSNRQ